MHPSECMKYLTSMNKNYLFFVCLILWNLISFGQRVPDENLLNSRAPEKFKARFETTRGSFTAEFYRTWSPQGVDRMYQLILTSFYTNNALFRVQKEYVVQFGICDIKEVNQFWDKHPIDDEPVVERNLKGTISYARDGVRTRTTQLFINKKDNFKLDTVNYNGLRGFPPIGKIVEGYEVVDQFYPDYGFEPANHQDSVMVKGNAYFKALFPQLDYIKNVTLLKD